MWQRKKLTLSGDAGASICSVLAVNPWTPGAPSNLDVTAILFIAPALSAFVGVLATAADVFPLSQLTQLWRRASSALSLLETRM
ncbi:MULTISPECIES: hypothetical protein [Raoultella]|uniref:hypothetical protein n=1 Tax=Raoultella TaxID=160674 RepID=UPI0015DBF32C|nr:hypothetical protein [Raoultella ornithinolytica]ELT0849318.1 hypothetical protein [Raoultella ornithinolytica]MCC2036239.1 hypothetical protein [Raoultella ornithinolytica]MCC2039980.1 hypothetical protein [Raoultella ornithinolytica]MCC2045866.1 hypothetical protein [Raoultella ornithinolytica]MCC2051419.1 hypothetical protein [Raoultella ornithinolytica]